jgi:hypothetical protein
MEDYSVKILDISNYRDSDSQTRVSVPLWFLDMISEAKTLASVDKAIALIKDSAEDELCKCKSIHLASVRKKVIEHDEKD